MEELIRYENVSISYQGQKVVKNIGFSVEKGQILGIVGESGSGKSTILKAAMGLLGTTGRVEEGSIYFEGKKLSDLNGKELWRINGSEIGMVFQNAGAHFCPIRTIEAQLYEADQAHKKRSRQLFRQEAEEQFRKLGLEDGRRILRSYPFELSGGMQQRVGIASAMLLHPKLLLADEPTSALDVVVQKRVIKELLLAREQYRTTIIIVTHNIGILRLLADQVLVMKEGEIVEYGATAQVLEASVQDYTKKLMAAVPRLVRS